MSAYSILTLTFSTSLYFGCQLGNHENSSFHIERANSEHPDCMMTRNLCFGVNLNQGYNCLIFKNEMSTRTQVENISHHFSGSSRLKFSNLMELLNNFQSMKALLITKKSLVDEYIECIVNIVFLFFAILT